MILPCKLTRFRLLRPLITSLLIVPFFIKGAAGAGTGLAQEVILTVAGLLIGLPASQMRVYLSPKTGRPITRAGLAYALVWVVVMVARTAFSYGSAHWFAVPLGRWLASHHVTADALTGALIFMALAMVLTRVAGLAIRSRAVRPPGTSTAIPTPTSPPAPMSPPAPSRAPGTRRDRPRRPRPALWRPMPPAS